VADEEDDTGAKDKKGAEAPFLMKNFAQMDKIKNIHMTVWMFFISDVISFFISIMPSC